MRELLEKVLPVPEASRSVLVFSFHDCPCETGTLRQGTLSPRLAAAIQNQACLNLPPAVFSPPAPAEGTPRDPKGKGLGAADVQRMLRVAISTDAFMEVFWQIYIQPDLIRAVWGTEATCSQPSRLLWT